MEDKKLQKEILRFIIKKYKEPKHKKAEIVNDISVEFKNKDYSQGIIDKNLYSLVKNNRISSGVRIDDTNHIIRSPLFVLEKGIEQIKPWYLKNFVKFIEISLLITMLIFTILLYFR